MDEEKFIEDIENSSGIDKIKALVQYSMYLRQSDMEKSLQLALQARELAQEAGDIKVEINTLVSIAYAHFYKSDFESAKRVSNEMIQYGTKTQNYGILGTAYNIKGRIAFKSENPALALELNFKALEYYLKEKDSVNLISCYNNLGMCQQHLQNEEEALNYFQLALEYANKINHPSRQILLQNMGTINFNKKKYKTALKQFQEAAFYFQENNLMTHLANAKYNIGLTFQRLNELEKSITYYNQSYNIQKKINDPKGQSYTCNSIGMALIDMKEFDKAHKFLSESLKIAKTHNLKWNEKVANESLAKYWELSKEYEKSTECLKKVILLSRELDQEVNKEKLSEMEAKYKTKIYQKQTRKLNVENKAMSEQIETLNKSLNAQRKNYEKLQNEFQKAATKINKQDDLLSSQSRMAVMGEMLSLISHQWRQPLNTIGVMVQSFQDAWSFDELTEEFINQQVDVVMDQIMYMSETINDFQDFFKLKTVEHFNLKEAIMKACNLLNFAFKKGGIELVTDFNCQCPVEGAPNDIVQVILNILNNARQAMETDKIEDPQIKISLMEVDEHARINIYNKGNNISPENISKLFEPYFTTRIQNGTGIGLYICQKIVENKFNGKIWVNNLPEGVEFSILLPLSKII